jgi:uncharacterized protein
VTPAPVVSVTTEAGAVVCRRCVLAKNPIRRMKGLLGRQSLEEDEGLLLEPASAVHTWFMRFPIDLAFLDRELRVVRIAPEVRPWRFAYARKSRSVLELPAGAAAHRGIQTGDRLVIS